MDASELQSQTPTSRRWNWLKIIGAKLVGLGVLWTSIQRLLLPVVDVLPFDQGTRRSIVFLVYASVAAVSVLIWFKGPIQWVHRRLSTATPWFVLVLLLLSGATLYVVRLLRSNPPAVRPQIIAVNFDLAHGQIFNSWQDKNSGHSQHIRAWGAERDPLLWDTTINSPDEASFSYEVDHRLKPSQGATSGAYQTFYGTPADRRVFHHFVFTIRSAEKCGVGKADIGIRLAVDNPQDNNEYFTYELTSLVKSRRPRIETIDQNPRQFDISVNEFQRIPRVRASAPLPRGLDENTINKIVFFVDNAIVDRCPKNTLIISGVRLQP